MIASSPRTFFVGGLAVTAPIACALGGVNDDGVYDDCGGMAAGACAMVMQHYLLFGADGVWFVKRKKMLVQRAAPARLWRVMA